MLISDTSAINLSAYAWSYSLRTFYRAYNIGSDMHSFRSSLLPQLGHGFDEFR